MQLALAIKQYTSYLENERMYSKVTVSGYRGNLDRFHSFLSENVERNITIHNTTLPIIRSYLNALGERGLKPKSLHREICAIRGLFKFLHDNEYIAANPTAKLGRPKIPDTKPYPLANEEVKRMLAAIPRHTIVGQRDYFILTFMLHTGVRLNEMLNITLRDIDYAGEQLYVRCGKGAKDRVIHLAAA